MKKIFFILCLVASYNIFADCYEQISQGQSSQVYNIKGGLGLPEYAELNSAALTEIMSVFIPSISNCSYKEIEVENAITCIDFPKSGQTCEVATTIGYFILHRSSFGSFDYSLIYTRWD